MIKLLAFITGVALSSWSMAYEIDTHSRITAFSYLRSALNEDATRQRLGLNKSRFRALDAVTLDTNFRLHLGQKYYDPLRVGGADRYATAFDAENSWVMKAYRASKPQRRWFYSQFDGRDEPYFPVDWMARGAVREDDTKALFACNPSEVFGAAAKHSVIEQEVHS